MEIQENMGHNHKQFSFIEITTKILETHTFRLWKDFQGVCEWWYIETDTQAHAEETRENSGDYNINRHPSLHMTYSLFWIKANLT